MYHDLKWSQSEKKVARRVYDSALEGELAEIMAEFKARATAVRTPDEMWELEGYLSAKRREIHEKYDYRYSRLILTLLGFFGRGEFAKITFTAYRRKSCRTFGASYRSRNPCERGRSFTPDRTSL